MIDRESRRVYNKREGGAMFGRATRRARDGRGQNLIEFALVCLLLAILLGGIWDLGRAFYAYINIANAAREGARYGARLPCLSSDPAQPTALKTAIFKAVTDEALASGLNLAAVGCDITGHIDLVPDPTSVGGCAAWEARNGSPLVVTVSCDFQPQMMGVSGVGPFTLTGRGTMAIFGNEIDYTP